MPTRILYLNVPVGEPFMFHLPEIAAKVYESSMAEVETAFINICNMCFIQRFKNNYDLLDPFGRH